MDTRLKSLLTEFFDILDKKEESSNGELRSAVSFYTHREHLRTKFNRVLSDLKNLTKEELDESLR